MAIGPTTSSRAFTRSGTRRRVRLGCVVVAMSCTGERATPARLPDVLPATPAALRAGDALFVAHCRQCHGEHALGTDRGPPLVHSVYAPNHHGDAAFLLAVRNGVRAHHWTFGDMPPLPGLGDAEVASITAYVRWLQRQAGIRQAGGD